MTKRTATGGYGLPDRLPANVDGMDPESYAALRRVAEDLAELPGLGKVEIADGEVIVMTAPVNRHELAVLRLRRQLDAQVSRTHPGYIAHAGADVEDPGLGKLRCPDIMVFPEASLENTEAALRPDEVLLVVEIVSRSNPRNDYRDKVADYSAMGIPHYVIVDPRDGTGIVHSLPGYRQRTAFVFGDTVSVGPWKLDTGGLLTYGPPRAAG
ncbi:Uma2 family endonuclease [Streptomyces sp. NBC_01198]|uniref:Uma2 family endonuclease n=1 Tax=Streptomyces sp. NBC_01198 TaxID=2903769 RepID=UPI002E0D8C8D|nr:Uma2 family endonuclease [Streptomyces sp. NBC_01198]